MIVTRRRPGIPDAGDAFARESGSRTVSLDEWLAHVAANPALTLVRLAANEEDTLRATRPARLIDRSSDGWLYWASGEIHANGPDPAVLAVMLGTARALDARVRHDEGSFRVAGSGGRRGRCGRFAERVDEALGPEEEEALAERRATQALVVAGTIACVASMMWLMQA